MLNPDFAEMLRALSAEGVEYLVVGAYAMAAHGVPRATGDIDVWVRSSPANAERVLRALHRFGAPLFDLTVADLTREGTVFQLGLPPRRIDLLTSIDGVTFEDAWPERVTSRFGDLEVTVIGREALVRNKRAAGRLKDLVDLRILARVRTSTKSAKRRGRRQRPTKPTRR
ncbi:MAG TPA: hypothetical protein VKU61_11450 [Candidatus Binatia bacterium]|nr:hypothetical protein [Candidatus Binatia bacterium]